MMAHKQGNKPGDDSSTLGLKFDSEKPRWELLPNEQLIEIVRIFNTLSKKEVGFDPLVYDREDLINDMLHRILSYKTANIISKQKFLAIIAFKMFFLLRGKPYIMEDFKKNQESEIRFDLIDMKDVEGVVNVYTMGAKKYADNNWKKVDKDRYYGALLRHFNTLRTDDRYDPELGCLHAHQVIWNLISLMWIESQVPEKIMNAAKKMQGLPAINIKTLKKKAAKKVAKKIKKRDRSRAFGNKIK